LNMGMQFEDTEAEDLVKYLSESDPTTADDLHMYFSRTRLQC